MVRSDGAEARKERIQEILRSVVAALNCGEEVILSKKIAEIQYNFGLTKPTVIEYLQIGSDLGRFDIDEKNGRIIKIQR